MYSNDELEMSWLKRFAKVKPATTKHGEQKRRHLRNSKRTSTIVDVPPLEMRVVRLHTLFKRYGGQRHPRLGTFEQLNERKELLEWRYDVDRNSTLIYISHEPVGTNHVDPRGDQMYHLLLLLERLQRGEVDRTDMDAFHSLLYKHNHTTTAEDWKRILNSQTTYIFYDGFCVPKEKREEAFLSIPAYVKRCDFMIILARRITNTIRFGKFEIRISFGPHTTISSQD